MKIIRRISVWAALAISVLFTSADDWAGLDRYAGANKTLMEQPADPQRVVLFGNSITDSWPGMRPDFFGSNALVGRGISGHTSYQFLVRFRQDVVDLKPLAVVINAGTNDVAENKYPFSPGQTLGNIKSMVEMAEANGIKVILTSVLPATRFKWRPALTDVPDKIKQLNALISEYAASKGLPYVDYHAALADAKTGGMRAGLSLDGVHPNAAGYAIMEAELLPVIESIRSIR